MTVTTTCLVRVFLSRGSLHEIEKWGHCMVVETSKRSSRNHAAGCLSVSGATCFNSARVVLQLLAAVLVVSAQHDERPVMVRRFAKLFADRRCSFAGAKAAIVEHGPLGGTCVNVGCVPKKVRCSLSDRSATSSSELLLACPRSCGLQPTSEKRCTMRQTTASMVLQPL